MYFRDKKLLVFLGKSTIASSVYTTASLLTARIFSFFTSSGSIRTPKTLLVWEVSVVGELFLPIRLISFFR
jgi:hypothetical protein